MTPTRTTAITAGSIFLLVCLTTFVQCTSDEQSNPTSTSTNATAPGNASTGAASPAKTPTDATAPGTSQTAAASSEPQPEPEVTGERIRMLISGGMDGRLEPCGCASGQLGGLARRLAHAQEMFGYDLLLEGGDLVRGNTPLDVAKAETAIQTLFAMPQITANIRRVSLDSSLVGPYHALGLSARDLELPIADFYEGFVNAFQVPIVASDLQAQSEMWPGKAFLEYDVRGTKVRIASLTLALPKALQDQDPAPLTLLDPASGWQRALEGADPETLTVVMVHGKARTIREVAEQLQPKPDLVIGVSGSYVEPPGSSERIGGVPVVFPGIRGRMLLDVTLARTTDGPALTTYDIIALRGSETKPGAGEDPSVRAMLLEHRNQVAEDDIQEKMAEQLPTPNGLAYVGSEQCRSCHSEAYDIWERSKHATAWTTLERGEIERYHAPVTQYPDCISCHVVGFREKSGFVNIKQTPHLGGVGCERCHGPGSAHVADPQIKMGKVGNGLPAMVCTQCHDFEQSPDFDYRQRWATIKHGK